MAMETRRVETPTGKGAAGSSADPQSPGPAGESHAVSRIVAAEVFGSQRLIKIDIRERVILDQCELIEFLRTQIFSLSGPCVVSSHHRNVLF